MTNAKSNLTSNDAIALGWLSRGAVRDPVREHFGPPARQFTFPIENVYARQQFVTQEETCPDCGGDLDTGFECGQCGRDYREFFDL